MRPLKTLYQLAIFTTVFHFASCVPQKQVTTHQQQLAIIDSQLVRHSEKLKALDQQRQNKQDQNEIDDTASLRLQKFIGMTNTEIDKLVTQNAILIGNTSVNKDDWNRLKQALTFSNSTSKLIGDKVSLINELINRNTVIKLDQDVLFGPGQYNLSPAVAYNIGKIFDPVAKEIDYFVKKYPDFPLSLVITAKGYADATAIEEGSFLYKKLVPRINTTATPTNEQINKELSNARAQSVIDLLKTFTVGKSADGNNVRNLLFLHEGKGEKFPNPKITDYTINDPRRRIVLLFWSIFPD
ncbi:hypothetical protein CAP36_10030 [Chitinophagaceae bacterium IBVUCB2]|nr:hypothetical protein CAP36_10030 [Chitinophagaceae bacterium IBVUCB2]